MPVSFSDYNVKRKIASNTILRASEFRSHIFNAPKYNISINSVYNNPFRPEITYQTYTDPQGDGVAVTESAGINQSNDAGEIQQLTLNDSFPPSQSLNQYQITSSGSIDGTSPSNAFDGNSSTLWRCPRNYYIGDGLYKGNTFTLANSVIYYGEWIQIKFPTSFTLTKTSITPSIVTSSQHRGPRNFVILGSNDEISWNFIANLTSPSTNSISNGTAYLYYRFVITAVGGTIYPVYRRLEFRGKSSDSNDINTTHRFNYTKRGNATPPTIILYMLGGGGGGGTNNGGGGGSGGFFGLDNEKNVTLIDQDSVIYYIKVGPGGGPGQDGNLTYMAGYVQSNPVIFYSINGGGRGGNSIDNQRNGGFGRNIPGITGISQNISRSGCGGGGALPNGSAGIGYTNGFNGQQNLSGGGGGIAAGASNGQAGYGYFSVFTNQPTTFPYSSYGNGGYGDSSGISGQNFTGSGGSGGPSGSNGGHGVVVITYRID